MPHRVEGGATSVAITATTHEQDSTMQDHIPDPVAENIRTAAQQMDASEDALTTAVLEQYEALGDQYSGETRWRGAFKLGKKNVVDDGSQQGGQSAGEMFTVVVLGHGRISGWPDRDHEDYEDDMPKSEVPRKDVLITNAIVQNEESGRVNLAIIAFDSTNENVNLGHVMDVFSEPKSVVSGRFNPSETRTYPNGLMLYSTDGTNLERAEDALTDEEVERLVEQYVDDVDIATLDQATYENLSMNDGRGPVDYGIDIKRVEGATIWDHWIADEPGKDYGRYNFLDDSVMSPEELDGTALDTSGSDYSCRGFTGWCHSNLMEYDTDSIVDFYGVVSENQDGQVTMDVRGIDPIIPNPLDTDEGDLGSQSSESF